jgi:ABC-type dipeptide/oligopeptide/nickel transport system ATPase component
LFRKLNRELQMAILYVSHDLASVARLCHTVGILEGGRLIRCGPAAELLAHSAAASRPGIPAFADRAGVVPALS